MKEKVYMPTYLTSIWTEVHNEMKATIDILNEGYSGDEELVIEECSGVTDDHSDRVKELIGDDHTCEGGAWITAIDGRVVGGGSLPPLPHSRDAGAHRLAPQRHRLWRHRGVRGVVVTKKFCHSPGE